MGAGWPMQLPRKQKSEQRRKHTERVGGAPGQGVLQQRGEVFSTAPA